MLGFKETWRLLHINQVLWRYGLDEIILATHLFRPVRFLKFFSPYYWFSKAPHQSRAVRIRLALEDLGPIFIKFGQLLSTRRDLLPDDIADELAKLQDAVPPFSSALAVNIIEKALNAPLSELFDDFDTKPIASASIAQVHGARLRNGDDVVIKVVRPGIEKIIRRDVALLMRIARMAERYSQKARPLHPVEVVEDYDKTIANELDLIHEAANASQLRTNFKNSSKLYVPKVYWDYCTTTVMCMERIYGTSISQLDVLKAKGISMEKLAEQGVEIFFTQVFRDNFFHADMHPGNIFVDDNGRYQAVDFGIIGTLTEEDKLYLAENLLAFFKRDYKRVAQLHLDSGWVPETTRVTEFEASIRTVSEPIFNRPISEISFGHYLLRLFQIARRYNMEVQPQLVLLQKTLLNIEGLGRVIYPQLDLWKTAKPFLERWTSDQLGPKAFFNRLKDYLPLASQQLPELPAMAFHLMKEAEEGKLKIQWQSEQLDKIEEQLQQNRKATTKVIIGSTLIILAVLFWWLSESIQFSFSPLIASGLGVVGIAFWIKALLM